MIAKEAVTAADPKLQILAVRSILQTLSPGCFGEKENRTDRKIPDEKEE